MHILCITWIACWHYKLLTRDFVRYKLVKTVEQVCIDEACLNKDTKMYNGKDSTFVQRWIVKLYKFIICLGDLGRCPSCTFQCGLPNRQSRHCLWAHKPLGPWMTNSVGVQRTCSWEGTPKILVPAVPFCIICHNWFGGLSNKRLLSASHGQLLILLQLFVV